MTVNICGIPHKVVECEDKFNTDCHFGQIDYKDCEIRINKDMTDVSKKETICHEMIHGIFVHLGYNDYANDEQLVQALGNAIYQGFNIEDIEKLPSINPKPKKGRWLDWAWDEDKHRYVGWLCSNCQRIKSNIGTKTDYCPACGIEMVNSQWSEEKE